MQFAEFPVEETEGAVLAHSVEASGTHYKKGHVIMASDITALQKAGRKTVYAAKLDTDDVGEDEAAHLLAAALQGPQTRLADAFTGRANIFAAADGLALIDANAISAINLVSEGITLATLSPMDKVVAGQMLATIKIIPFAVKRSDLDKVLALAGGPNTALSVAPYRLKSADLILTSLPGSKASLLTKAQTVIGARLADLNIKLISVRTCTHTEAAITAALKGSPSDSQMTLILGASATVDRNDVVPAGLVAAGGEVQHFGMPVDPGNLLLLGSLGARPVLGLPGCARSPKLNGADWVLARLAAGLSILSTDIQAMGVGGLLKEVPSRPQPRARKPALDKTAAGKTKRIAAIILAAGQSTRMGPQNKLTTEVGLKPMVAHVADAALSSKVDEIILVTGHEPDAVLASLGGRPLTTTHNPDYAAGLSTSVAKGISAALECDPPVDAAIILLGDMPFVDAALINTLIAAHAPQEDQLIAVPTVQGKRGNPVLWDASFFPELLALSGDRGAKHLIAENEDLLIEVPFESTAPLIDIDTRDALKQFSPD